MQVTRKHIISVAMDLIERDGADAISMHRLASELGCGLMALYNQVPSKSALLDSVADTVLSGMEIATTPGASWCDRIRAQAGAFRQVATRYPRCTLTLAGRQPTTAAMLRPVENALASLGDAGFSGHDAARIVRTFAAYLLGSLLRDVGVAPGLSGDDAEAPRPVPRPAEFPQVTGLASDLSNSGPDADFEFGLDLLVQAVGALRTTPAPAQMAMASSTGTTSAVVSPNGPASPPISTGPPSMPTYPTPATTAMPRVGRSGSARPAADNKSGKVDDKPTPKMAKPAIAPAASGLASAQASPAAAVSPLPRSTSTDPNLAASRSPVSRPTAMATLKPA